MATTVKKYWSAGEGFCYCTYDGSGNGDITITSDKNRQPVDRDTYFTVQCTDGTKKVMIHIVQEACEADYVSDGAWTVHNGSVSDGTMTLKDYTWGASAITYNF